MENRERRSGRPGPLVGENPTNPTKKTPGYTRAVGGGGVGSDLCHRRRDSGLGQAWVRRRFRRPDGGLRPWNALQPAKAVAPMQACAVHLRDHTPKQNAVAWAGWPSSGDMGWLWPPCSHRRSRLTHRCKRCLGVSCFIYRRQGRQIRFHENVHEKFAVLIREPEFRGELAHHLNRLIKQPQVHVSLHHVALPLEFSEGYWGGWTGAWLVGTDHE
jgi:hypothetical protein